MTWQIYFFMCDFTSASGRGGGSGCWRYKMIIINMMDLTLKCSWFSRRRSKKSMRIWELCHRIQHKQLSNFASHGCGSFSSAGNFFAPSGPVWSTHSRKPGPGPTLLCKIRGKMPENLWSDCVFVLSKRVKGANHSRLNEKELVWAKCVFFRSYINIRARVYHGERLGAGKFVLLYASKEMKRYILWKASEIFE